MKNILYVYHATPGLNGAYVDCLRMAFERLRVSVVFAVNSRYVYGDGGRSAVWRIFFPFTEGIAFRRLDKYRLFRLFRRALRYLEMIYAALILAGYVIVRRVDAVNYSLTESYLINYWTFRLFRMFVPRVVVTVHDVIPHTGKVDRIRRKIFEQADVLLVHNKRARDLLAREAPDCALKVRVHVFPWSLEAPITCPVNPEGAGGLGRVTFCFAGFIRWSKGLDLLVDEWVANFASDEGARLIVAGTPEVDMRPIMERAKGVQNIEWRIRRLNDGEYLSLLDEADVVCMPYRATYAHSSVHLVAYLWARRPILAANVGPFFEDVTSGGGFVYEEAGLGDMLRHVRVTSRERLRRAGEVGRAHLVARLAQLPSELDRLYSEVLEIGDAGLLDDVKQSTGSAAL